MGFVNEVDCTANQTLFQIHFSKNHPRRNLKNNAENGFGLPRWQRQRVEPLQTSFSNSVRALFRICSHTKTPSKMNGDFVWLGMRDSNPRMHGPKPCALPLGQSPITRLIITQKGFELLIQGILVTISVKLVSAESRPALNIL